MRGEEAFTPEVETRLREHDQLLVVTAAGTRGATEDRLRAVDQRGKLARWHERSGPQRRRGPGRTP